MTQVLTGHGCFGRYLYHVARREPTLEFQHCSGYDEKMIIQRSMRSHTAPLLQSEMHDFCESIISQEMVGQERESSSSLSAPFRCRRAGGRKRPFVQLRSL